MITALNPSPTPITLSNSRPLRYGVFFYLYVMQGIPAGFYTTALTNYFAAEGIRPDLVGSFVAIISLPWAFQFVWGPLIDRFQGSPMGRRKPWVVGAQTMAILATLTLLLVSNPTSQITTLSWLFFVRSIFAAIQDASVDAMAITVIPEEERGRTNGFMRIGYLAGYGGGAAFFAPILREASFHAAALTLVLCLLTGAVLMLFVREKPGDQLIPSFGRTRPTPFRSPADRNDRMGGEAHQSTDNLVETHDFKWLFRELFRGLLAKRSLLLFGAIILAYVSVAMFLRAYNFTLIRDLKWRDTDLSVLTGTYGMVAAVFISLTGGYIADRIGPRRLLLIMLVVVAAYLVGFNLISDLWVRPEVARTGLIALFFMDPCISVAAMPMLMSICRRGVEGSQFTTYMAFVNLSDIVGTFVAGNALLVITAPTIGLLAGCLAGVAILVLLFTLRHFRRESVRPANP